MSQATTDRELAILFSDVEGSTELRSRKSDAAAELSGDPVGAAEP